jgi:hypothetical protein
LSSLQLEAALYAVRDLISRRVLGGQPVREEIKNLYEQLIAASAHGTRSETAEGESIEEDDLIDTRQAAAIIGCSARWARRIHADLDGQKCGGRWVFRRQAVAEYAGLKGSRG